MLRWITIVLLVLGAVRGAAAEDGWQDPAEDLVRRALDSNPTLEAQRRRIQALQSRTVQAGARPEPMLGIEYSNMPVTAPVPGNHPMSGLQLRLQQTLLAPGTVPQRVSAAEARVRVGEASYEEGRVTLAAAVRRAYWRLALTRQLRSVTEDHLVQVSRLLEAVRVEYEVGAAGQHDLLNLQLLRDRLSDDLHDYDQTDREITSALAAAVLADEPLDVSTPAETASPSRPGSFDDLVERAAAVNPTLTRLDATAAAERTASETARREAWPDVTLWAGYRVRAPIDGGDDGTNQVTFGLSVPLPTAAAKQWGGQLAEHAALARAARSDADSALNDIRTDLDTALARWERADEKATTYRDQLIPDARRALDATFSAYQVGRADYASLFQAEVQLLDLERAVRVAETEVVLAEVDVAEKLGMAERVRRGEPR